MTKIYLFKFSWHMVTQFNGGQHWWTLPPFRGQMATPSHHLVNVHCECPHRALKHFIYLASCTEYLSTKILGRNSSRIIRVRPSRQEKITWLLWKWKGSCYIPSSSFRFSRQNFHRSIKVYVLYTVWKILFYKYPNFLFNIIQTDLKSWV